MNTNQIRKFATEARIHLLKGVSNSLRSFFRENGEPVIEPKPVQGGCAFGEQIKDEAFLRRWQSLQHQISLHGFRGVVEQVAYTWFNRFVAINILAKNNLAEPMLQFAGSTVRVPYIVEQARAGHFPEMSAADMATLRELLNNDALTYEQFSLLIGCYCTANPIIRRCFGRVDDYSFLLLPSNILGEGEIVDMLNRSDLITDDDYRSPELIGWLYQFYISERKDEVFAKKGKFEADEIPAATQIFTPNWIVKYMVQNSLGRIYLDNEPYSDLKLSMQYLVGGAVSHCTDSTNIGGAVSHCTTNNNELSHCTDTGNQYSNLLETQCGETSLLLNDTDCNSMCGETPHLLFTDVKELTCADLACGSGHILNECFDLLYDIYIEQGYSRRDAVENIFAHNLIGIDIDTRAKQLATFALLLKACRRDGTFADAHAMPRVLDMPEPYRSNISIRDTLQHFFLGGTPKQIDETAEAIALFDHAEDLGSIMRFNLSPGTREAIVRRLAEYRASDIHTFDGLFPYFDIILALTDKYATVVMNPPYMGSGNMNVTLSKYVKENYADGKADLMTVFILLAESLIKENGKFGMITLPSWLFLSTFENLRTEIVENYHIDSLLHMGRGIFGIDWGSTAFVISKSKDTSTGTYFRLHKRNFQHIYYYHIEKLFLNALKDENFKYDFDSYRDDEVVEADINFLSSQDGLKICYPNISQSNFAKIPGNPIGYWVSEKVRETFTRNLPLSAVCKPTQGLATADNGRFLRSWFEVSQNRIGFGFENAASAARSQKKWFPYNKGGAFRKWYGNQDFVVNWENDGYEIKHIVDEKGKLRSRPQNTEFFFKNSISWSKISAGSIAFRQYPFGFIFDVAGTSLFPINGSSYYYILGIVNSKAIRHLLSIISPTLNFEVGQIAKLPIAEVNNPIIQQMVQSCISISKEDWDAHETSWDFKQNELVKLGGAVSHCTENAQCAKSCGETPHLLKFVNKKKYIYITGNKLPHWNQSDCVQFVTFRLADSLPQVKLQEYKEIKDKWLVAHPKPWDIATQAEYDRTIGSKIDKWLDSGYGNCILKDEKIRKIVEEAILHFNEERYYLHAYVIMPNHVHVLLTPIEDNLVQSIVGSWKKFTAHEINKILGLSGSIWERECFDCMIRNDEDFEAKLNYIENNPQYLPSSAYTLNVGGAVSHCTDTSDQCTKSCGETPHLLSKCDETSKLLSKCDETSKLLSKCGETPHLLTRLEDLMNAYKQKWERLFMQLHSNEEELNRQFIEIYGLQDELTPNVPLDEITILQQGEIHIENNDIVWHDDVIAKQLISYAIGCWMGRYRLDKPGLHIAHPNPTAEEVCTYTHNGSEFEIDDDGIIPILSADSQFADNACNRLRDFLRIAFDEEDLQENINFIETCLGKSLETYFIKDFWKDHKKMYQNRPIYWLFSSKKGAFQCLAYMHRMDAYTVERVRSKYLLPHMDWLKHRINELRADDAMLTTAQRKTAERLEKELAECREYHDRLHYVADRQIAFDLDDGVVLNYAKFGDILAKIK